MDREAWWATVRWAAQSQTGLSAGGCAQTHIHTYIHLTYQTVIYLNYNPLK